ncbi:MAG: hypothetical protein PF503_00740 [Desulfobacula sp.]|jgi:hypothetical protein|nr:hypothetical protein [Desulfobacula sp.]
MVFERRMSEFMAVSESNLTCDLQVRACSNVHPADVRRSAWNGLCKISYGKYPGQSLLLLTNSKFLSNYLKWYGSEALPAVVMLEAMITFFFAGFVNLCRIYSRQLRVYHQIVSKHNRISH